MPGTRKIGRRQDVTERIDPVVAAPVRDQQRLVVDHGHEARRVAARAGVGVALAVAGSDDEEWRQRDEVAAELVEMVEDLLLRKRADLPEMRAKIVLRPDRRPAARASAIHCESPRWPLA
jgi:hypothetical protein